MKESKKVRFLLYQKKLKTIRITFSDKFIIKSPKYAPIFYFSYKMESIKTF